MLSTDEIKKLVAEKAVDLVQDGMVLGIGSGSTVAYFIAAIAKKFREGLVCTSVPTSSQTKLLAGKEGIKLTELNDVSFIDLTIDQRRWRLFITGENGSSIFTPIGCNCR